MNELVIVLDSVNPICIEQSSIQFRKQWHTFMNSHTESKITTTKSIMSFLGWAMMKLPMLHSPPRLDVNELFYSGLLNRTSGYFKAIKKIMVVPDEYANELSKGEVMLVFEYQSNPNEVDEILYSELNYLLVSLFSTFDTGNTSCYYCSGGFSFMIEIQDGGCRYLDVSIEG